MSSCGRIWSFLVLFCFWGVCEGLRVERNSGNHDLDVHRAVCKSPIDIMEDRVTGLATVNILKELRDMNVTVKKNVTKTGNRITLQLLPKIAGSCVKEEFLCYIRSEIRWGKTNEEGSDHTLEGKHSEMEIQHYFNNPIKDTIGVSVRYSNPESVISKREADPNNLQRNFLEYEEEVTSANDYEDYDNSTTTTTTTTTTTPSTTTSQNMAALLADASPLEKLEFLIKDQAKEISLKINSALPTKAIYYQYNGSDPGKCEDHVVWVVYKEELSVKESLLTELRLLVTDDFPTHYSQSSNSPKEILMWHYKKIAKPAPESTPEPTPEPTPVAASASNRFLNPRLLVILIVILLVFYFLI